jgi:hypothetical protein
MTFERSHRILDDVRMITVSWHKVRHRCYWVHRSPVKEIL